MRNYKSITLSILITLIAFAAIAIVTRGDRSYAATDKKTVKVWRKKDQLAVKPTAQEAAAAAPSPEVERELEDNIPKHLPLKIKVRNLKSEKWVRDFALEITNTSDKPIYYLRMFIDLPDIKAEDGINLGFPLQYGRGALVSFSAPIEPDDVPIKPGESYTLKITEQLQLGWERFVKRRDIAKDEPKKIKFIFQTLNFGDGTGFRFTSGRPFDIHKRRRELMQREAERKNSTAATTPDEPPDRFPLPLSTSSTFFLPATFLPVKFSPASVTKSTFVGTVSSSDICCPASSCQSLREEIVYCCAEIKKAVHSPCSDPSGACTTYTSRNVSCNDEFGTYCIEDILADDPCPPPGATPTPTPNATPTPTPSPTPATQCTEDCTRCNPGGYCELLPAQPPRRMMRV